MAIDREKGVRVVTVGELLDEGLTIPSYQRPYSWEPATALQLFDDIREAFKAENAAPNALPHADQVQWPSYVLGAVILHRDNENVQIHVVDGQQRLLTLTILLDLLDEASEGHIEVLPIEQEDPAARVVRVRTELARRVRHMEEPAEAFADFIRSTCEIIRVETDDADEAFRVFDSQNYRGKSLLPHDLLKAYHLREMSDESDAMREALVEGWQNVPDAELDRLFSTYLWRIKRWTRGLSAPTFSTRYIDSFKGLTPKLASTPAARYHLAAQTAVPMLAAWVEHSDEANRTTNRTRFQIDAPVVAGRSFFEMVTFMLAELRRLREEGFDEQDGTRARKVLGPLRVHGRRLSRAPIASKVSIRFRALSGSTALLHKQIRRGRDSRGKEPVVHVGLHPPDELPAASASHREQPRQFHRPQCIGFRSSSEC